MCDFFVWSEIESNFLHKAFNLFGAIIEIIVRFPIE